MNVRDATNMRAFERSMLQKQVSIGVGGGDGMKGNKVMKLSTESTNILRRATKDRESDGVKLKRGTMDGEDANNTTAHS
jgi:hypothetical protein